MNKLRSLTVCLFSLWALSAGEANPPPLPRPGGLLSGFRVDLHAAVPLGSLAADVNDQLGFGFGLGYEARLGSRTAFRASFRWTGYRVSDRNLGSRMLATLLDVGYDEDRLILRSYALGGDFLGYQDEGCLGPYLLMGGGIQRSRMYAEHRSVDDQGNEVVQNLAAWPAADTPFANFGLGYRGRSGVFMEGRVVLWRYRAEPGVRLMETSPNASNQLRDAVSFTMAVGVGF